MKIITSTDSEAFYSRLNILLADLPGISISGATRGLEEAKQFLTNENDIAVLIVAFHNLRETIFSKLREIKNYKSNLRVIVLTNNFGDQYLTRWKEAGADYVFDQAFQFTKMIDVLAGILYENHLVTLKSNIS
jgi:DNA-binding response OmpR family regulator